MRNINFESKLYLFFRMGTVHQLGDFSEKKSRKFHNLRFFFLNFVPILKIVKKKAYFGLEIQEIGF